MECPFLGRSQTISYKSVDTQKKRYRLWTPNDLSNGNKCNEDIDYGWSHSPDTEKNIKPSIDALYQHKIKTSPPIKYNEIETFPPVKSNEIQFNYEISSLYQPTEIPINWYQPNFSDTTQKPNTNLNHPISKTPRAEFTPIFAPSYAIPTYRLPDIPNTVTLTNTNAPTPLNVHNALTLNNNIPLNVHNSKSIDNTPIQTTQSRNFRGGRAQEIESFSNLLAPAWEVTPQRLKVQLFKNVEVYRNKKPFRPSPIDPTPILY